MKNRLFVPLLLLLFLFSLLSPILSSRAAKSLPYPTIDGFWSPDEWPTYILHTYRFNRVGGLTVQFGYRINATDIIMTARYQDLNPSFYNKSCESPRFNICSDAFAVGFDNNGDQINMGTIASPDDAIFIGSQGNYSIDTYMQGIGNKIVYDTSVGGLNNTFGRYSYDNTTHYFTFEMAKALKSNDSLGHDINLNQGDQINIMLAFWDDLPPTYEISGFTDWIRINIIDPPLTIVEFSDYFLPVSLALITVFILAVVPRISKHL